MDIIPHIGIGHIKFGLNEAEIIDLLGEPTRYERVAFEADQSEMVTLYFDSHGLELCLSSDEDFRLDSITIRSEVYQLFGVSYWGRAETFLVEASEKDALSDLKLTDEFPQIHARDYHSDALGLSFWIQDGIINPITMFPAYDASGNVVQWPE